MAIDPGTQTARFLPQCLRYSSVAVYRVSVGLYLLSYVESFMEAIRLPVRDS